MTIKPPSDKAPARRNLSLTEGECPSPLDLNLPKLGKGFFQSGYSQRVLGLLIHELGHEYESNHLSANYYRALTKIGARLALAVAANPNLIRDTAPSGLRLVHSRADPPPTD